MKGVCFFSMLVFLSLNLMGQNEGYESYYRHINEHLANGKCESAQRLYDIYKMESGRTDKNIEARIAQCIRGHGRKKQIKKNRQDYQIVIEKPVSLDRTEETEDFNRSKLYEDCGNKDTVSSNKVTATATVHCYLPVRTK